MPKPLRCDPSLFTKDLKDQVIIVTGANSGCGLETSRQLAQQGATVILACRNAQRGEDAVKEVGGAAVFLTTLDLASLESVKAFVDKFLSTYTRLDALINNAGIMACPHDKTKEGFELQLGSNHLAHFYLMRLLTPLLLATAEKTGTPSRFVALSSVAAGVSGMMPEIPAIDFDDLMWEKKEYKEIGAYCQSKLANYLHAMEAAKKYPADKLISTAVHPGWVLSNLDSHAAKKMFGDGFLGKSVASILRKIFMWKGDLITAKDGAQATLYCILEDADKMESGAFYSQIGIYKDPELCPGGWPLKKSINPNATSENAAKLWDVSEKLVGL
jgi:NAD(P)-dependent dehydrogenase (short-subunit alcohol dehydrogenase family)